MASTNLGFVLVDDRPFFLLRYLDLSTTVPLLIVTLGLLSGTRLVETLFLTALSSLMFLTQLFCGLHPEGNRWSTNHQSATTHGRPFSTITSVRLWLIC